MGYWQRPELSRERFKARLADGSDGQHLRTGDLGFIHEGVLFITGRLADLIIIRGRNLYPQDIERSVERCHPLCHLGGAAAFTVERDGEERLVIVQELTRSGSRDVQSEAIIAAIRHTVAGEHDAEIFAIILLKSGGLPKTSSGKVQRHACRNGFVSGNLPHVAAWQNNGQNSRKEHACQHQAPPSADAIEAWMLDWVGTKIGKPAGSLDATQEFASFGLDSLALVELGSAMDAWLGRSTRDVMVFDYPTIRRLACHLANLDAPGPALPAVAAAKTNEMDSLLAQIECMTDAEAEAALRQARP
jgi:acyl carrier protein